MTLIYAKKTRSSRPPNPRLPPALRYPPANTPTNRCSGNTIDVEMVNIFSEYPCYPANRPINIARHDRAFPPSCLS
jgi:hypothetical protein